MSDDNNQQLTDRIVKLRREMGQPGSTDLPRYVAASDLHGNHWRLDEIVRIAREQNAAKIFLVGDTFAGQGGWSVYRMLEPLVDEANPEIGLIWGNHELALVAGMLGNDSQFRFCYGFGGRELLQEMSGELADRRQPTLEVELNENLPNRDVIEQIRGFEPLREMTRWIQRTHRMIELDVYGTGYMHASPRITRSGRLELQYQSKTGLEALRLMETDLSQLESSDHPVCSALLQTDTSPLWGLHEITSAGQFDTAYRPLGVRQLVFGHRHRANAENIAAANRQIGIAVDFDEGLGGYLCVGPRMLRFQKFVSEKDHRTDSDELTVPIGPTSAELTHLTHIEEFLVSRFIESKAMLFRELSPASSRYRREFEQLDAMRKQGCTWIHRLYAELYPLVKDLTVRKEMFAIVIDSCDEEAFKSLIHLLYYRIRELQEYGTNWYDEAYLETKSFVQVLLEALREMPVHRLGLLDTSLRGTTSRVNLLELYQKVMGLQDPDLAIMAIDNLAALNDWAADQEIRRAFFHDARKVRVRAAQALASRGEVTYPLVRTLMRTADNWVRFLAVWTCGKLGATTLALRAQAIKDLQQCLRNEPDWLVYTTGQELLRGLGATAADDLPERTEIPNLTDEVMATLQAIVDSQLEPFRKAFKVYYMSVVISSLVYRRGLIGLDLDELRIYVNNADYFPPHFRYYKSAARDQDGLWQGWRRLWIRGETFNRPDGPQIIEISAKDAANRPTVSEQTVWIYDHRTSDLRVALPDLDGLTQRFGSGKVKDRVRDSLMRNWTTLDHEQQTVVCRLHAAAVVKMLFDLPAELFVTPAELETLNLLSDRDQGPLPPLPVPLLTVEPATDLVEASDSKEPTVFIARANWLDAIKYSVDLHLLTE